MMLATDTPASSSSCICTLSWVDKLVCFPFFLVFLQPTNTCPWIILSPSLHYNDKIRERERQRGLQHTCKITFLLLRSWRLSGSSSFTHTTSLAVQTVSGSLPSPVIWTITGSREEKDSCSWPKIAQTTQGSRWLEYRLPRHHCICKISDPTWKKNSNEYHFKGFQQGNQSSLQCGMHFLSNYCKLHTQAQGQDF